MPPAKLSELIRRVAEIEDELASRGLKELVTELETVRDELKTAMMEQQLDKSFDETSGYGASLSVRRRDTFHKGPLTEFFRLSPKRQERYLRGVDVEAMKEGLANGDLSRAKLEQVGAVTKEPYSVALTVKKVAAEDAN